MKSLWKFVAIHTQIITKPSKLLIMEFASSEAGWGFRPCPTTTTAMQSHPRFSQPTSHGDTPLAQKRKVSFLSLREYQISVNTLMLQIWEGRNGGSGRDTCNFTSSSQFLVCCPSKIPSRGWNRSLYIQVMMSLIVAPFMASPLCAVQNAKMDHILQFLVLNQ